jgi:hypothetical protein
MRVFMASHTLLSLVSAFALITPLTAGDAKPDAPPARGLLVALSQFEVTPGGKVLPKPKAARLEMLVPAEGMWDVISLEDPESNVFHKAMAYDDGDGPRILTLGGTAAAVKLWSKKGGEWIAETVWSKDFGGKFSRMREAEVADLYADGRAILAVATHDQGVVALIAPDGEGGWTIEEIDRQERTFVHEIEIGDLSGDGKLEVYATPSEPNMLDGRPQPGKVVRYVPSAKIGRTVVADLGDRHAKEILVDDVDGDGRDELYVSVEAVSGGKLEIRRYDTDTDPKKGRVVARLEDKLCRFLTAGDVEGDGRKEIIAAGAKSGLWVLRPPLDAKAEWSLMSIDRNSSGFEHAALLADLDGDAADELYVASDDQGEIRRYVWRDGRFRKEVILRRAVPDSVFTWNLQPAPSSLFR